MTDQLLAWLRSTGRVAAGIMLMIVAGIAVFGTKQWAGLVFVAIGAVSVGLGIRAIRQRKQSLPLDSQDSQPANSQPGP